MLKQMHFLNELSHATTKCMINSTAIMWKSFLNFGKDCSKVVNTIASNEEIAEREALENEGFFYH